jgi:opacity protein-like surface antigen
MKNSRKLLNIFTLIAIGMFILFADVRAQNSNTANDEDNDTQEYVPSGALKNIFFDAGYGANDFAFALGFRYKFFGASFGVDGIGHKMPSYQQNDYVSADQVLSTQKEPYVGVIGDAYYFYDFNEKWTAFGSLGFYVASDSVFARKKEDKSDKLYRFAAENKNGVCIGAGIEYFLDENWALGLAYHSRRGAFIRFTYKWF